MKTQMPRILLGVVLVICIIASLFINISTAGDQLFILVNYSYKSSANTEEIYPGSRNVVLTVNVQYNGSSTVYVTAGCINLPEGFTPTRGYSTCSPPQKANGTTYELIQPGDIIVFTYHVDVSKNTTPGVYEASLTIHYRVGESSYSENVTGIVFTVSEYPPLSLQVVDWYWNPAGYPGSKDVYLYITLKNTGNSRIITASGVARLSEEAFTPSTLRFQLNNLGKGELVTIALGPISIYPEADPNITYRVVLEVNATMSTDDDVNYYDQGTVNFYVTLTSPPAIKLEVLDYGLETPKAVSGLRQARFYTVLVNKDFKTIRSITAYYSITSPGALFTNSSTTSMTVYQGVVDYGGVVSLYSDPIVVENVNYVSIKVKLVVFGDDNGAEFWSTLNYVFTVPISQPSIDLEITNIYWSNGEVYPGSESATLNTIILNRDVVDVRDAAVTAQLSRGFHPEQTTVGDITIQRGSMTTIVFRGISIETNITPGEYPVHLTIKGVTYDPTTNTYYSFTASYTASIRVSEAPRLIVLNVTSYGWIGDKVYTTSVNSAFYTYIQLVAPGHTVRGLRVTAILPDQMVFTSGERTRVVVSENTYRYGDHIYVEFTGVNIVTSNSGIYPIVLKIEGLATCTAEYWFTEYYTILLPVLEPLLNITLIDASWTTSPVSPISSETSGAGLQLILQSYSLDTISSIVARIVLYNAVFNDGRNYSVASIQRPINYGEVFTLEFTGIEVNTTALYATIEITSVLTTGRSSYYRALCIYNVIVNTLERLEVFRVIGVHTTIRGEYSPLLPSSRGVTVTIELANTKPYQVAWVQVEVTTPPEIIVNDITGTCSGGVIAGGLCTISLNIDVASNTTPGVRELELTLTYAVRSNQALAVFTEKHNVSLIISDYEYYKPKLTLVSAYWGVQAPIRALTGQRNVPLTITILNTGYYSVDGVYVEVKSLNGSVTLITDTAMCTPRLASGASCTVTFYTDLSGIANTSKVVFEVTVKYSFTLYNTLINDSEKFTVALIVEEAASGRGLLVVDVSWSNNRPVYPNTENATLQVTLANMWPYRVSGLQLELELPSGFYSKTGERAVEYVPGPISSLQVLTAQFTVSTGNISPGLYTARLKSTYVIETGNPNTRVLEEYTITITINSLENSIRVISAEWIGKAPEPPEYGVTLQVSVRNNLVPSMSGVILEIELPEGFYASSTNTSYIATPASSVNIVEELRRSIPGLEEQQIPPQIIQALLSQVTTSTTPSSVFSYGDIMYFYLKLNIVTEKRGVFTFRGYVNFIDHWNNIRRIPVEFNVTLLGSTKLIQLQAPVSVKVEKGASTLEIGLLNTGSAPLYNIYLYLAPYSAMLIPQDAVKYIDTLPPGELVHVNYTLIYNPFAVATGGVQAYLRYMSAPFMLTLLYRDVYGNVYYYNTSLAVIIEPFIDLNVVSTKTTLRNNVLSVSGVAVNYGITTARSVVVRLVYGNYTSETLLGDLDPASQTAFRLELSVPHTTENSALLVVEYKDEYGRIERLNYNLTLARVEYTESPISTQPTGISHYAYITVTVAVIAFLSIVALILYRYLRVHVVKLIRGFKT
jgi:hypothetical protein